MRDKSMNLKLNLSFKTKKLKKKVGDPLTWAITSELKLYNGHAIHIKNNKVSM